MILTTQKDLANILGITARQIRELKQMQGMFNTFEQTRKYNLAACVQEYIRYKIECEGGDGNADYEKERAEHERAKKEITKLKLRKLRRELHEAADVEAAIGDMLACFRSKLLSAPSKLAPQLIGIVDASEIIGLLKQEVTEALLELSDYNPEDYSEEVENEPEDEEANNEDM